ncbi:MAG: 16S rRNA (guanine(527)-N(7))-methyltransferase RsmG [Solirubrobacterales bacterium 70-9]|nr:MAG: 16S rRNA (guanine(527)-N(7))-methyltransferase RsmG [Solirubrobacterales bacterium 70-9]
MTTDPAAVFSDAQRRSLQTVLDLLAAERASVSSVVDERAWKVHVEDSLTGLDVPELERASRIADLGAGAGFPGLVLAVSLPDVQVDLIDSIGKKTAFIAHAAAEAGIPNAHAITARAEDIARQEPPAGGREAYDVVAARAVGRLSTLAELASPLLQQGGVLVAWKGRRDAEEEAQMARAAESLAMTPEQILDVGHRAGSEHRHLHVLRKAGPTPANLPRKAGMAKKRPAGGGRGS